MHFGSTRKSRREEKLRCILYMIRVNRRGPWSLEATVNCWFGPQSMPTVSCLRWRALALLGALLSMILVLPFTCCAARPISATTNFTSPATMFPDPEIRQDASLKVTEKQLYKIVLHNDTKTSSDITNHYVNNNNVLSRTERSVNQRQQRTKKQRDLDRNERSANLSHITGTTRKFQLYIKNRFLQLLPDGSVNGTHDDASDYSKCAAELLTFYCSFNRKITEFCEARKVLI